MLSQVSPNPPDESGLSKRDCAIPPPSGVVMTNRQEGLPFVPGRHRRLTDECRGSVTEPGRMRAPVFCASENGKSQKEINRGLTAMQAAPQANAAAAHEMIKARDIGRLMPARWFARLSAARRTTSSLSAVEPGDSGAESSSARETQRGFSLPVLSTRAAICESGGLRTTALSITMSRIAAKKPRMEISHTTGSAVQGRKAKTSCSPVKSPNRTVAKSAALRTQSDTT